MRLLNSIAIVLMVVVGNASAFQTIDVVDGGVYHATVSRNNITRLVVDGGRVKETRFNMGEVATDTDADRGQVFFSIPERLDKPVSGFVTTNAGTTFTLVLNPVDGPGDSIILREPKPKALPKPSSSAFAETQHAKVRRIALAMYGKECPSDALCTTTREKILLWKEVQFTLLRKAETTDLIAESYELVNLTSSEMVISEAEFYKKGVVAIVVENLILGPSASTRLHIFSRGSEQP